MIARPNAFAALVAILTCTCAFAQAGRHELGLRLRAFERHLAVANDAQRVDAALAEFESAVQAFFRLDLPAVAERVDAAERALLGGGFTAPQRRARSLQLTLARRLVGRGEATVGFELSQLYEVGEAGADAGREAGAGRDAGADAGRDAGTDAGADTGTDTGAGRLTLVVSLPALEPQRFTIGELPFEAELALRDLAAGDHEVVWSIVGSGGETLVERRQGLSVAEDLEPRFRAVDEAAEAAEERSPATIESATLPALRSLLRFMRRGTPHETVLAGDELLREAERLVDAMSAEPPQQLYRQERSGSFHLRVPVGRRIAAARLFVPTVPEGERRPLVVALHGAGGSENLFFDGYGDGACVALAAERGWFAVAPRNSMGSVDVVGLVDALAARYSIDVERVFVVGHSMGAMAAMGAVARNPERFRAVAPLSGGGRAGRGDAFARLPFLIAAGGRDFGAAGSSRLRRAIEAAGATVDWRVYEPADHFTVVQLALPDVFAFFDRHAR